MRSRASSVLCIELACRSRQRYSLRCEGAGYLQAKFNFTARHFTRRFQTLLISASIAVDQQCISLRSLLRPAATALPLAFRCLYLLY